MAKYINADELKEKLRCWELTDVFAIIEEKVDEMPSADVVEVVRCKDCIYAIPNGEVYLCSCMTNPNYCSGDDFCSYGEKKDENDK